MVLKTNLQSTDPNRWAPDLAGPSPCSLPAAISKQGLGIFEYKEMVFTAGTSVEFSTDEDFSAINANNMSLALIT